MALSYINKCIKPIQFNSFNSNIHIYNQFKECLENSNLCSASETLVIRPGILSKIDYSPSQNKEYEIFYYPKNTLNKYYFIKYDKFNEQFNKILVKFFYASVHKSEDDIKELKIFKDIFDPHIGFNSDDNTLLIMLDLTSSNTKEARNLINNSSYDALIFEIQLETTDSPKDTINTVEYYSNKWQDTQSYFESKFRKNGIRTPLKKRNPYQKENGFNPELLINMDDNKYIIKNIHLNDWEVIRNGSQNIYPFLCFIPSGCNFYILKKDNIFKVLILFEEMSSTTVKNFLFYNEDRDGGFYNSVSFVLDVKIKNNLLIPEFEPSKSENNKNWDDFTLFKYLYKIYGTPEILLWHLKDNNDNIFTENQKLIGNDDLRLMKYEVYENLGNELYEGTIEFSNFLDTESSSFNEMNIIDNTKEILNKYNNFRSFMESLQTETLTNSDNDTFIENINIIKQNLIKSNMLNDVSNNNFNKAIDKFKDETQFCKITCPNEEKSNMLISEITEIINELELLRNNYSEKINWINISFGILSIINENSQLLLDIIYINTLINNLYIVLKIIKKGCRDYDCKELIVLRNSLKISKIPNRDFKIRETIFQIFSGYIIRENQWIKYQEIINNYEHRENPLEVHQFMMGKGKSSVITPLLILYFTSIGKNINIILPKTLEADANKDQYLLKNIMKLNFNICNDIDAKKKFLHDTHWLRHFNKETDNNSVNTEERKGLIGLDNISENVKFNTEYVNLYDEFDFLYDPIKSNFNFVPQQGKQFYDKDLVLFIFDCIISYYEGINISDLKRLRSYKESFKYNIVCEEIYSNFYNNFIKNMNYGMPLDNKLRYVIPYLRKDLPLENSSFNSIITTIMLTLLYFKENNYNLEYPDYVHILISNNKDLLNILDLDKNVYKELLSKEHSHKSIVKLKKYVEKATEDIRKKFTLQYFIDHIMPTIFITEKIYNCSFVDIIGNRYKQWQVGYTGTVNFNLPLYNEQDTDIFKNVLKDYDEALNVYFALTGTYITSKNNLFKLTKSTDSSLENIINFFVKDNSYNVLIDAGAYLIDESNKDIVTSISDLVGYQNRYMIFINSDIDNNGVLSNKKMVLHNNDLFNYKNEIYNTDELFIYYSQQNTIGVDIKQPAILKGLIIIDDWNTYTQISQAIYRCRKLNIGQTIDILYIGNNDFDNSTESKIKLYEMLIQNNINELKSKAYLELKQNLKYCVRKLTDDYSETDIKPTFSINDNTANELTKHNPIDELRCMQRIKNNIKGLNIGVDNKLYLNCYETVIGCDCISDSYTASDEKESPWCEIDENCLSFKLKNYNNDKFDNFIKMQKDLNYSWNYINKIKDIASNDKEIIDILLEKINNFPKNKLIDFTFKANLENVNYQIDIEQELEQVLEEEEEQEEEQEIQINIIGDDALTDIDKYFRQQVWLPNIHIDISKYLIYLFQTKLDKLSIFISLNIFNKDLDSLFFIKINPDSILVESNTIMFWYYDKCPIYTVTGQLVNFFEGADTYLDIPDELFIFADYKLDDNNIEFIFENLKRNSPEWKPGSQIQQFGYKPENEFKFNNLSFTILISILCKKKVINPKIDLLDYLIYTSNDYLIELIETKILDFTESNNLICDFVYKNANNNDFYVILNNELSPLKNYTDISNLSFTNNSIKDSEDLENVPKQEEINEINNISDSIEDLGKCVLC